MWFGCHSDSGYALHYQGLPYSPGLTTLRTSVAAGNNFADTVTSTAEDQVAGWNWDLGTVDGVTEVRMAIAAASDYASLLAALMEVVPVELQAVAVD